MSNEGQNTGKLDVRAYPIPEPKGNILGSATINFDTPFGNFAVKDIRIMNGPTGPFAAMPNRKDQEGNYKDICFPTTKEGRAELNTVLVDAFIAAKEKMQEKAQEKLSVKDQIKDDAKKPKEKPAQDKAKAAKKPEPEL